MKKLEKRHPIYAALLRLYPKPYQKRYAQEILQTTDDMLASAPNRRTKLGLTTRLTIDLPLNAGKQQLHYVGGIMQSETPHYIKRNALLSSVLLLPFVLAITANALDTLINHRGLYQSWLWQAPYLRIWVIILPALAFLCAAASYITFVIKHSVTKQTWLKHLVDVRHIWPIILPGFMAFAVLFLVLFHDSTHCLVQTPAHLLTHLSQTWQCTMANRAFHI